MECAACGSEFVEGEEGVKIGQKVVHEECAGLLGVAHPSKPPLVQASPLPDKPGPTVKPTRRPPLVSENGSWTFPIVLDERRRVEVPLEFDEADLEYTFGVLDLYVRRRSKQRGAP